MRLENKVGVKVMAWPPWGNRYYESCIYTPPPEATEIIFVAKAGGGGSSGGISVKGYMVAPVRGHEGETWAESPLTIGKSYKLIIGKAGKGAEVNADGEYGEDTKVLGIDNQFSIVCKGGAGGVLHKHQPEFQQQLFNKCCDTEIISGLSSLRDGERGFVQVIEYH